MRTSGLVRLVASSLALSLGALGVFALAPGTTTVASAAKAKATTTTTAPNTTTTAPTTTTTGPTITWSVEPATASGPTGKPAFVYNDVSPGDRLHGYAGVINYSSTPVTFTLYPADAVDTNTGGFDVVRQGQKSIGIGAWTTLAKSTATIPAGLEANVPFTIQVPTNATPGDHYGGIMAQISSTSKGKGGNFLVNRRVGARIYMHVVGPLHPSLEIQNLTVDYHGTVNPFAAGAATVSYTVTNNGNVALAGDQIVSITSIFGTLASTPAPRVVNLIPGASQDIKVTLSGIPPAGPIDAKVTLTPSLPKGTNGKVTTKHPATLATFQQSTGAWAFPWPQLLLFVLLILALWRFRRWRKRRGTKLERAVAAAREEGRKEGEATGKDDDSATEDGGSPTVNGDSPTGDGGPSDGPSAEVDDDPGEKVGVTRE